MDAVAVVRARSRAAIAGAGERNVEADLAIMLLSGVAAAPEEAFGVVQGSALTVVGVILGGEHGLLEIVRGAMLEMFVLGALVGTGDGGVP